MFSQRVSFKNATVVVEFPRSYTPSVSVNEITVHQKQSAHDVLVLSVSGYTRATESQLSEGAPVKIKWSGSGSSSTFYGYVHNVKQNSSLPKKGVEITCVSASFVFAQKNKKSWTDRSATQIVRELCLENGFAVDSEEGSRKYPHLSQQGMSNWQFLKRLADESGYVLRAEGLTVQFVPRKRIEEFFMPSAPVLSKNTLVHKGVTHKPSLLSFEPIVGVYTPTTRGELSSKVATYVSMDTGESISLTRRNNSISKSDPEASFSSFVDTPFVSMSDADASLNAAVERDRFIYTATAKALGSPLLSVEKPVYINDASSEYSGYWTVLEATHTFDKNGGYLTRLLLGTDSLGNPIRYTDSPYTMESNITAPLDYRLSYPYAEPILDEKSESNGVSGKMIKDFSWKSTNRKHR